MHCREGSGRRRATTVPRMQDLLSSLDSTSTIQGRNRSKSIPLGGSLHFKDKTDVDNTIHDLSFINQRNTKSPGLRSNVSRSHTIPLVKHKRRKKKSKEEYRLSYVVYDQNVDGEKPLSAGSGKREDGSAGIVKDIPQAWTEDMVSKSVKTECENRVSNETKSGHTMPKSILVTKSKYGSGNRSNSNNNVSIKLPEMPSDYSNQKDFQLLIAPKVLTEPGDEKKVASPEQETEYDDELASTTAVTDDAVRVREREQRTKMLLRWDIIFLLLI